MIRRSIRVERGGQEYRVSCYAPGDGSLSFVSRQESDGVSENKSIQINEKEAREIRDAYFKEHLLVNLNKKEGQPERWALASNVERVDDSHLEMNAQIYEVGEKINNDIAPYKIYINHETFGKNEVHSPGTAGSLNFYLKNESLIESQKNKYGNEEVIMMQKENQISHDKGSPKLGM